MKPVNCLICNNPVQSLTKLDGDINKLHYIGIVGKVTMGFGSKFNGQTLRIAICDKCIEQKQLKPIE